MHPLQLELLAKDRVSEIARSAKPAPAPAPVHQPATKAPPLRRRSLRLLSWRFGLAL
jgi:hypothetical protein